MRNKIVLITGATGGIGKQTALSLAKIGAQVIVTGRSRSSGEEAVTELRQISGNRRVELLLADLSTLAGIRSLVEQFKQKYDRLDVLINNAGFVAPERQLTEDGIESDFAVNVITPFLLTHLLMDNLNASPAAHARVITLMGGEAKGSIDLNNLQAERSFSGLNTYSHTKMVMMAIMLEFAQRVARHECNHQYLLSGSSPHEYDPQCHSGYAPWLYAFYISSFQTGGAKRWREVRGEGVTFFDLPRIFAGSGRC
jgi:NAD(P)-dependent dehydrogenase (short-subunit alcohol dehydrogenase family)